jgi:hypothetical protein
VPIREAHTLRRELVDIRRGDLAALGVIALHIAVTEVVSEDDEDVGFFRRESSGAKREEKEERSHGLGGFELLGLLCLASTLGF